MYMYILLEHGSLMYICVYTLVQFTGCVLYLDSHFGILLFFFGHEVKYNVTVVVLSRDQFLVQQRIALM